MAQVLSVNSIDIPLTGPKLHPSGAKQLGMKHFAQIYITLPLFGINHKAPKTLHGVGGYSKTNFVHMPDQRFSKHTLKAIYPHQEKHPLNENFM